MAIVRVGVHENYNWFGTIVIPGATPFHFNTIAPTSAKAKSNSIFQYAKVLNMSVPNLVRYLKTTTHKFEIFQGQGK